MAKKKWKRKTDNKMRDSGEIDWHTGTIRINKKKSKSEKSKKKYGTKAGVLDTIVHEEMHRIHPKMTEREVRKRTKRKTEKMSRRVKKKHYSKYKG